MAFIKFEDLKVRQSAQDLFVKLSNAKVKDDDSFIYNKLLDESLSLANAIALGNDKFEKGERTRLLNEAKSKAVSLKSTLHVAREVDALDLDVCDDLIDNSSFVAAMLFKYVRAINTPKKAPAKEAVAV